MGTNRRFWVVSTALAAVVSVALLPVSARASSAFSQVAFTSRDAGWAPLDASGAELAPSAKGGSLFAVGDDGKVMMRAGIDRMETPEHSTLAGSSGHAKYISVGAQGELHQERAVNDLTVSASADRRWPRNAAFEFMLMAAVFTVCLVRAHPFARYLRSIVSSIRLNERERVARELHDTFLQGLQSLLLRLQVICDRVKSEPEHAHCLIEQALVRADAMLEEGRDCVRDLRSTDNQGDLSQVFLRVAEDAQPRPSHVCVTIEGMPRKLHGIPRREVERIGVEAMRNALRHAHASKIDVELVFERHELSLRVSDDGIGLSPAIAIAASERHFGIKGMRERAQRIGADFSIASRQGRGTEIELLVPAGVAYARAHGSSVSLWRQLIGKTRRWAQQDGWRRLHRR